MKCCQLLQHKICEIPRNCSREGKYSRNDKFWCNQHYKLMFKEVPPRPVAIVAVRSKNSHTALTGLEAEQLMTTNSGIKRDLMAFFKKEISVVEKVPGVRKSDLVVRFVDGKNIFLQNKNSTLPWSNGGQGHHVDRRPISKLTSSPGLNSLFQMVCIDRQRPSQIDNLNSSDFESIIDEVFLSGVFSPDYLTRTRTDGCGNIHLEGIISVQELTLQLKSDILNPNMFIGAFNGKNIKTTIPITPNLYIQRKGGSRTDKNADHAQVKFKCGRDLFSRIKGHKFF